MKRELTRKDELVKLYPQLMGDIAEALAKMGKSEGELLEYVEFHFGGNSYRIFAWLQAGSFHYIMGKPGIYLLNDSSITVDDPDAIFVETNDPSVLVMPAGARIYFALPYDLQVNRLVNQEKRGWNEEYFIMTCGGSALEKAFQSKKGTEICNSLQKVAEDYQACFDFESNALMYLSSDAFDLYSAKPFSKRIRANNLPMFKGVYEAWKALTDNNSSGSWCFMAYDFDYHGNRYRLTCGNLVEYDIFYKDANVKIREKLLSMGAKDLQFVCSKVM